MGRPAARQRSDARCRGLPRCVRRLDPGIDLARLHGERDVGDARRTVPRSSRVARPQPVAVAHLAGPFGSFSGAFTERGTSTPDALASFAESFADVAAAESVGDAQIGR